MPDYVINKIIERATRGKDQVGLAEMYPGGYAVVSLIGGCEKVSMYPTIDAARGDYIKTVLELGGGEGLWFMN